jgi:hypothetical protein
MALLWNNIANSEHFQNLIIGQIAPNLGIREAITPFPIVLIVFFYPLENIKCYKYS